MYSLVHVEPRYIAPFIALLWLGLYSAVSVPDIHILSARRLLASVGLAVVLGMTVEMAGLLVLRMPSEEKSAEHGHVQWKVSQELKRLGIRPGDRLASLGSGYTAYWARLAGSKIVAETRRAADFWAADEKTRSEILEIFAKTGARGVVAREVPPVAASAGWHALGNSGFSFYRLRS